MSEATKSPHPQADYGEGILAAALARGELADDAPSGPERSRLRRLIVNRDVAIASAGILLFILFPLTTNTFLTEFNLTNMIRNVSLIGIVAVGMTFLLIVGEIDLSVGSVLGFLVILFGVFDDRLGLGPWIAALLVIPIGVMTGALNGLIRVLLNIPSFIVTLAMLTAYRSLALIISHERPISVAGEGAFFWLTGGAVFGIPWLIVWMLAVMIIGSIILRSTRYGFHAYATGGNPEAARDSGINTGRVKLIAFALTGGLCGLAAALLFGYLHVAEPTSGTGFEFRVIGAAIVGGTALTGGFGTILGTFIGTLIIAIITSGMVLLGYSQGATDLSTGFLIVAVGIVDLLVQRAAMPSRFS
jgi:ribose/xylose/arabinose/galactoside ABC-type transport system permease subunit